MFLYKHGVKKIVVFRMTNNRIDLYHGQWTSCRERNVSSIEVSSLCEPKGEVDIINISDSLLPIGHHDQGNYLADACLHCVQHPQVVCKCPNNHHLRY